MDFMNEVVAVIPSKWRAVGIQLGLSQGSLDGIQSNHAGKPQACQSSFEEVFSEWKKQATTTTYSPFTWTSVINALMTPAVGEVSLAESLQEKLTK